jgi:copper homeostasis protein
MQRDILIAKQLGATGVVFGLLSLDGRIDRPRMESLIELARPLKVTCHRAFDMADDLPQALEDLITLRVDRVLTSGSQKSAIDAMPTLKQLVQKAAARIQIMACGEISITNVKAVVNYTGVTEVHVGLGDSVPSAMRFKNSRIAMGSLTGAEYQRTVVSEHSVRELRAALDSL